MQDGGCLLSSSSVSIVETAQTGWHTDVQNDCTHLALHEVWCNCEAMR